MLSDIRASWTSHCSLSRPKSLSGPVPDDPAAVDYPADIRCVQSSGHPAIQWISIGKFGGQSSTYPADIQI